MIVGFIKIYTHTYTKQMKRQVGTFNGNGQSPFANLQNTAANIMQHCDSWENHMIDQNKKMRWRNYPIDHGKIRKLSVTISLNDPDEYEGGNLEFDFRNQVDWERNKKESNKSCDRN